MYMYMYIAVVLHYNCSRNWFSKTQTSQISELYGLLKIFANARLIAVTYIVNFLRLATL